MRRTLATLALAAGLLLALVPSALAHRLDMDGAFAIATWQARDHCGRADDQRCADYPFGARTIDAVGDHTWHVRIWYIEEETGFPWQYPQRVCHTRVVVEHDGDSHNAGKWC